MTGNERDMLVYMKRQTIATETISEELRSIRIALESIASLASREAQDRLDWVDDDPDYVPDFMKPIQD